MITSHFHLHPQFIYGSFHIIYISIRTVLPGFSKCINRYPQYIHYLSIKEFNATKFARSEMKGVQNQTISAVEKENFSNEGNASAVLSYFVEESNVDCAKLVVNSKTKQKKNLLEDQSILKAKNRLCKIRFRINNNTLLIKVAEINAARNERENSRIFYGGPKDNYTTGWSV